MVVFVFSKSAMICAPLAFRELPPKLHADTGSKRQGVPTESRSQSGSGILELGEALVLLETD